MRTQVASLTAADKFSSECLTYLNPDSTQILLGENSSDSAIPQYAESKLPFYPG